jgi:Cu/Zn superoxide dismutase
MANSHGGALTPITVSRIRFRVVMTADFAACAPSSPSMHVHEEGDRFNE